MNIAGLDVYEAFMIFSRDWFSRDVPATRVFRVLTYLAWCFPWWICKVFLPIVGLSAEMPKGRGGSSYVALLTATASIVSKMSRCSIAIINLV